MSATTNNYAQSSTTVGTPPASPPNTKLGIPASATSGQDSIGRVAADRERYQAGADYAGNSKGCGRSNVLVEIRPEAWAVTWGKLVNGAVE